MASAAAAGNAADPYAVVGGGAAGMPFMPLLKNKGPLVVHAEPVALLPVGGGAGGVQRPSGLPGIAAAVVDYLSAAHGVPAHRLRVTDAYSDAASGMTHVYVAQHVGGVDVANAVANVNISPDGAVVSSSQSFAAAAALEAAAGALEGPAAAAARAGAAGDGPAQARQALVVLAAHLGTPLSAEEASAVGAAVEASVVGRQPGVALDRVPARVAASGTATASRALVQLADGRVAAAWRVNVEQQDHWWNAVVDVAAGRVAALADWYARSESYYVFPRDVASPADGPRRLVADPASGAASPDGWSAAGMTAGNNAWAQSNPSGGSRWRHNHRARAQAGGVFNSTLDLQQAPEQYVDAAITQLFYTTNMMHDLAFAYGFDEAAGNFQEVNHSGLGVGGDAVIANAQDGSGTNNANFATPPDGQRPQMRMYVWTATQPARDGDLEQDIVAHEYTHGISNRLTGGPANSDCLVTGESGGMGEGWSDAVANLLRLRATDTAATQMVMGDYVAGKNIRTHPYATSLAVNPLTFGYLDRPDFQEVHAIGEVWAEMLYEVTWALIARNGFADDLMAHDVSKGNALALQLLLDGMKLQPCNPSFVDARDAILQAEARLTSGSNR
ncbi:hypothetical protein LPJ61_006065, partial [Coemansia biformis]